MHRHQCAGQICVAHRKQMGEIQVLGTTKQIIIIIIIIIITLRTLLLIELWPLYFKGCWTSVPFLNIRFILREPAS